MQHVCRLRHSACILFHGYRDGAPDTGGDSSNSLEAPSLDSAPWLAGHSHKYESNVSSDRPPASLEHLPSVRAKSVPLYFGL